MKQSKLLPAILLLWLTARLLAQPVTNEPPTLRFDSGELPTITLSWPQEAAAFRLEEATRFAPEADWRVHPIAPIPSGLFYTVTVQATNGSRYYRLHLPAGGGLPPDPQTVAPDLDPTGITDFAAGTAFLYTGSDPIQTDVQPGTLDPQRQAVLRGRVTDSDGAPLPGAAISILQHPEFGRTLTRSDGQFDLAVNGGGWLTVRYTHEGYLSAQRRLKVPWQDYLWAPEVVLLPADSRVTVVDLQAADEIQTAQGNPVSDDDGVRQATVLIPRNTSAELVLPNGTTLALDTLTVRATEYTVGNRGPRAMSAELPPNTGYTYCVELSADEGLAAGATEVRFNQPLSFYLENFLDFPVGGIVPAGYYDRAQGRWIPSANGLVLEVLPATGDLANVDTDGDGTAEDAATLAALGLTEAERRQLAAQYQPGTTLWRVPILHFTPWDCNWPYGPPPDARPPGLPWLNGPPEDDPCDPPCPTVEFQSQSLGEAVPIAGTPFALHYRSARAPGRAEAYSLSIPLTTDEVPLSLKRVEIDIQVAGRQLTQSFSPHPEDSFDFVWDNLDAYGRRVQGAQPIHARVGHVYDAVYYEPASLDEAFGAVSGVPIENSRARGEITLWQEFEDTIGQLDPRTAGLGGWTLNVHHAYDPVTQTLFQGNGTRRHVGDSRIIVRIAGTGETRSHANVDEGTPALETSFRSLADVAFAPDGSLYIADPEDHRVRKLSLDGLINTVAGNGYAGHSGDDGPASAAQLEEPSSLAVGPDGTLYIASFAPGRVRRVAPDGLITTVAGNGEPPFVLIPNGTPAIDAAIAPFGVAVGPDDNLYFSGASHGRVYRIGPDGLITTFAGGAGSGDPGDGGPATQAKLRFPWGLTTGPDGSLYIADYDDDRVRRVGPDGIITTFAGTGVSGFDGDGGPATAAQLHSPVHLALGPDGTVYISDLANFRVRYVTPQGTIHTLAGNGELFFEDFTFHDGLPPTAGPVTSQGLAVGPDGSLTLADYVYGVRRIINQIPSVSPTGHTALSRDARELFVFDGDGHHLRTLDTLTGIALLQFSYTDQLLTGIQDRDAHLTRIERDPQGQATAVISPDGRRTKLAHDAAGSLTRIANPLDQAYQMHYRDDGLLIQTTDPRGNTFNYTHDAQGRLLSYRDPDNAEASTLSHSGNRRSYQVTHTTPAGLATTYTVQHHPDGGKQRSLVDPTGAETLLSVGPDAARQVTYPDGSTLTSTEQPDPRFGPLHPTIASRVVTTPGGITTTVSRGITATLEDPSNPLSLLTLTETLELNGQIFETTFNATERTLTRISPAGRTSTTTLDDRGRPATIAVDQLAPVIVTHDSDGRLVRLAQGAQSWSYAYNPATGQLAYETNALGETTRFVFDPADRLTEIVSPAGRRYGFGFDPNGNRTQVVMPSGDVFETRYHPANLDAGYSPPQSNPFSVLFNPDRVPVRLTFPSGQQIIHTLEAGRLTGVDYPDASIELTYSAGSGCCGISEHLEQLTRTPSSADPSQELTLQYDGDLLVGLAWSGPASGNYTFHYDDRQLPVSRTLDSGEPVSLTRDADGLRTGEGPFTLSRTGPLGAVTRITGVGLDLEQTHDELGRLQYRTVTVDGHPVYALELQYNEAGRITRSRETVEGVPSEWRYAYDPDGWLTNVTLDGSTFQSFAYDPNGNRIAPSAAYDLQDRLTQLGPTPVDVDADGFLTRHGSDTFHYSARGELLTATVASATIHYSYDGLWRRVARTEAGATHQYLYGNPANPYQVTAVRHPDGVLTECFYDEEDRLFALLRADTWYLVGADHLGTPKVVADAQGTVVAVREYDSYGVQASDTNPSFDLPIGYAGGLEDPVTGLVRFGYRDYQPAAGRWTARDPMLFHSGQANLYAYAANNPVNLRDPYGLWCVGGGAGAGLYVGGQLCCSSGGKGGTGCSICGEIGVGVGGGASFNPTASRPPSGGNLNAQVGASVGPASANVSGTVDECGPSVGGGVEVGTGAGVSASAKVTAGGCGRLF